MTFDSNGRPILKPFAFSIAFTGWIIKNTPQSGDLYLSPLDGFSVVPPRQVRIMALAVHWLEGCYDTFSYVFNNCATYSIKIDGKTAIEVKGCSMLPYGEIKKRRDESDCFLYKLRDLAVFVPSYFGSENILACVENKDVDMEKIKGNSKFAVVLHTVYLVPANEGL